MPKISVIIPFYNAENFITDSLGRVCNQTLRDIEIICVDDGSTDRTAEILDEFGRKDRRITVVHQNNKGAGAARNCGLRLAKGGCLSFLDADDIYELNMLEIAYKKYVDDQAEIVVFNSDHYDNEMGTYSSAGSAIHKNLMPPYNPFSADSIKTNIFGSVVGWAWDKLFDTVFIKEHQLEFQEQRTTNDAFFVFCAFASAKRISICDQVLVHHRVNVNNSLSVTREKSWDCFYKALVKMKEYLISQKLFDRFEQDFVNYSLSFSFWHLRTIKMPEKELLYNKLRGEYFNNLGITDHSVYYFYSKKLYIRYILIRLLPFKTASKIRKLI